MAKKINVKLILELRSAGMGRNAIAASRHISMLTLHASYTKVIIPGLRPALVAVERSQTAVQLI